MSEPFDAAISDLMHRYRNDGSCEKEIYDALEAAKTAHTCSVCCGRALPGDKQCVCGGQGTEWGEAQGLREYALKCEKEIERLRAELAEARTDTARLDWREANPNHGFGLYADGTWADCKGGNHPTYRAAIDIARKEGS